VVEPPTHHRERYPGAYPAPGTSGLVYAEDVPVMASPVVEYFEGALHPTSAEADELVGAVHRLMEQADAVRGCGCGPTPTP
jgi:hypothetical protein